MTNISQSLVYKTAAKINCHKYGTKLRNHCHPVYKSERKTQLELVSDSQCTMTNGRDSSNSAELSDSALLIAAVSSDACHANITTSPISAAAAAGATASVTERCRAFPASASAQYCQQATPSKKSIIVYKGPRPFESSSNGAVADTKYLHVLLMGLSENDMLLSCVGLNSCEFGFCFRRIWAKFGT